MAYLPVELARLAPDADTAPFWEACRRRELVLQRCVACGRFQHPPLAGCRECGGTRLEWARVGGRGTVFSYTIAHHPFLPALQEHVPYNVVVVELDDAAGVRLVSNLVDTPPGEIRVGMRVELVWEEVGAEVVLPRFRRAR
jgi:uncharacterized OB-fold protein